MRHSVQGFRLFFAVVSLFIAGLIAGPAHAQGLHPVESRLRREFPTVALGSPAATFEPGEAMANGRTVPGLQLAARDVADSGLRILYPRFFDDVIVAEAGGQRVVLRAIGARGVAAQPANGKLIYEGTYDSVDAIEVPDGHRSEELLLLRDERAPLVYDYEIVEMTGVAAVVLHDGAIRFMPPAAAKAGPWQGSTPSLEIERPWVVDASGKRLDSAARWTLGQGATPHTIHLTLNDGLTYPLVVDPSFTTTGSIVNGRENFTATLLPNGKVLIAAGYPAFNSPQLYDPANGTFSATGSLATFRMDQTGTLLPNGKVLIAGGYYAGTSAELYDPASGTFSATGPMIASRWGHTATLLSNGKVLLAGGATDGTGTSVNSAELYDPASGTFSATTGLMVAARTYHTATLLPNGKVLIAGGFGPSSLASAELFDPATGTFSATTGPMATARSGHTAALLPNGKVLIAGGIVTSAELYNPATGTFSATTGPMVTARAYATATLLPNGNVLIAGGSNSSGGTVYTSAELYNPTSGTFSLTASMAAERDRHTATLLPNGKVLIAGGRSSTTQGLSSAELYDPAAGTFSATGSPGTTRQGHAATLLPNGSVLMTGGTPSTSVELYDATSGTFSATGPLAVPRTFPTATLLTNGKVLVAGGSDAGGTNNLNSAELYDPAGGTFSSAGTMTTVRRWHTATLLPNGKVLIAGGVSPGNGSAELYDPVSGTFGATGSLVTARDAHTATLLPNGKVLLAGGSATASAELYDPATGTFSATGPMVTTHSFHTATLLPNGKVLIAGGFGGVAAAELYNPATNTFSATAPMATARGLHTATLLPNGKVLITGGYDGGPAIPSAELYDPAIGTFSATGAMTTGRYQHTATLLLNGKVLMAGYASTAELYDVGDGYLSSRRPVISTASASVIEPAAISVTGTLFQGDSEASGSATNNSATNFPILQVMRIDNEETRFIRPGADWSATSFTSIPLFGLTGGHYRATIFTNAIPSVSKMILILGPTITDTSPNTCLPPAGGTSITLTGTNLLNGTVTVNGNPATVTSTTSTSVVFTTPAGTASSTANVVVTTTGGTAPTSFTYGPATPTATNGGPYCPGNTIQLNTPAVAGATYAWTGPGGFASSLQNPTRASATTAHSGMYSVTVTVNGCTSAAGSTNVVVNATPATPTATNGGPYCSGNTIQLNTPAVAGATYAWTGPGGFTSSLQNPTRASATTAHSGMYSVTVTVNSCPSAAGSTNVVVNATPATPTATNGGPYCPGNTIQLNTPAVAGATYAWTGPGGFTSSLQNPTRASATTADGGMYSVTVTVNSCPSAAGTTNVVVNPTPPTPTISGGPTTFCQGGSVTLTSSSATGNQWRVNGSPIGSATNQTYVATAAGDYTVVVTTNNCPSAASAITTVTVNPNPDATITAQGSVADNTTGHPASVANAGAGATYNWSITNGSITAGAGTTNITYTSGNVGTLTLQVTVTMPTGCSDTKSVNVTVSPQPPVTITSVVPAAGKTTGGRDVTINGGNFQSGATISFGGSAATNVVFVNSSKLTAKTPAHAAGFVNVTVTNPDSSSGTLTNGYKYVAQQFDSNGDGIIDPSDIFWLVNYLFLGGAPPAGATGMLSGDANGDGVVDAADIFYLVNYLFLGGPAPAAQAPRVTTSSTAKISGAVTLGTPVLRNGKYIVPVRVSTGADSLTPQALSLRVTFSEAVRGAVIHRAGVTADVQPAFEISRPLPGSLAYLVVFDERVGGSGLAAGRRSVVAEIEIEARADTSISIDVDPAVTLLSDQGGTRRATVASGALRVSGTKIEPRQQQIEQPKKNAE